KGRGVLTPSNCGLLSGKKTYHALIGNVTIRVMPRAESDRYRAPVKIILLIIAIFALVFACKDKSSARSEVVLYTSVDEPVARQIIQAFENQTGIHVLLRPDAEATKTAGLAERLEAEKSQPQADVWWSNEIFHTINLANHGIVAAYDSPAAAEIPARYKDP